jgi:prolyl 4-hydroxylase
MASLCALAADVEEGGETAFPHGRWLDQAVQAAPPYTECASKGVAVKPRKGDAILFFSLKVDGGCCDAAF